MGNIENVKSSVYYQNICKILDRFQLNSNKFCAIIGVNSTYVLDLKTGKTKRISDKVADKILAVFPAISRSWLLTGEGEMLRVSGDVVTNTAVGNRGSVVQGKTVSAPAPELDIIRSQQDTIRQQSDQISRLISIIESKI